MTPDRRSLLIAAALAVAPTIGRAAAPPDDAAIHPGPIPDGHGADVAGPSAVIDLWPAGPPGGERVSAHQAVIDRTAPGGPRDLAYTHVTHPTLSVFRPVQPNGAAMLILSGGAYLRVAMDKEGDDLARWLSARGVTCFVLLYRLPGDGWTAGLDAPLQDAQRALRLIRHRAADYGVDPARVGVMGFSAGGHLAARLATAYARPVYAPTDEADAGSLRPDIAGLAYPVATLAGTVQPAASPYAPITVSPGAPPTFILHAADDATVPVEISLALFTALKAAGVPAELHVFEQGGHGFGLRGVEGKPAAAWPELFWAWSRGHGFV